MQDDERLNIEGHDTESLQHESLQHGTQHSLKKVSEEKDLGITIDRNLTFAKHIGEKVAKAKPGHGHDPKMLCTHRPGKFQVAV